MKKSGFLRSQFRPVAGRDDTASVNIVLPALVTAGSSGQRANIGLNLAQLGKSPEFQANPNRKFFVEIKSW